MGAASVAARAAGVAAEAARAFGIEARAGFAVSWRDQPMSDTTGIKADGPEDEAPTGSERRGDPRHLACFPAHVETTEGEGNPRSALIRDLSVSGALLLTRARLEVGDTVRLSLYLKEGDEPYFTTARVVRNERRSIEVAHPWTKAVAVQFDEPIKALDAEAKALAERQAALAGRAKPA